MKRLPSYATTIGTTTHCPLSNNFPHSSPARSHFIAPDVPRLLKTIQGINLEGEWTQTTAGEEFLLLDDGDQSRIIAFATSDNLTDLCNADTLFCDGTFYTCPTKFHQIYTIHAKIEDQMYPFVYSLLPNKTHATYERLFTLLKTKMTELNLQLNPTTVFLDFETAAQNAIRIIFPAVILKGYFFHMPTMTTSDYWYEEPLYYPLFLWTV
ncbi:uncharacterized protein LOC117328064 [Pecten maximus]|uniref:uncharacterized protein LOC117328064 n=1 Tax=Pecten maximus TaxID=6579 RepID=UPI00145875B5|nr:uncharacterized protein LOC117328064 [Pecten maximus]